MDIRKVKKLIELLEELQRLRLLQQHRLRPLQKRHRLRN